MISKDIVNRTQQPSVAEGVCFERRPFLSIFATKDQKESMKTVTKGRRGISATGSPGSFGSSL